MGKGHIVKGGQGVRGSWGQTYRSCTMSTPGALGETSTLMNPSSGLPPDPRFSFLILIKTSMVAIVYIVS